MASSNLETLHRMITAFNDRDVETWIASLDPEVELYSLRAQLEGKPYVGPESAREMFADFDEDWAYLRIAMDEAREQGDDVVTLCHLQGRGRASGIDLEVPVGFLWRFRNGKLVYGRTFSKQSDALRAAGLE